MAVTKIRKISSWTLIFVTIVLLGVLGLFLFGGDNPPYGGKSWYPKNTDILLYWTYIILAITLVATVIFALLQFVNNFRTDAKKALVGLGVVVAFAALLFITYSIGSGESIARLASSSSAAYNIPSWLKFADMMIFSIYAMFAVTLIAIVAGIVKNILTK
jgi:TRAP-type C4-dicarboxylate transport system permease small subunit